MSKIVSVAWVLVFIFVLFSPRVFASELPIDPHRDACLHGKIRELGTPDPLAEALVVVMGTTRTAEADDRGVYRLSVAPGKVCLRAMAAGYAPAQKIVEVRPGQDLGLNFSLERVDFASATVVVKAKKDKPQVLTTTLSRDEIKQIPGTSGDAVRAVQNLPGIAVAGDFSGQLAVQGGGPDDNLYLLDNVPWPFPFHFDGALSTVNSDLLSGVDLNSAGFGVRWGGVMGSVLDAKTQPGPEDFIHGTLDTNMISTQVLLQGPLGIGDATFTLSGRRSYMDLFFQKAFAGTFNAFPYFWDLGATLDFSLDSHNHFHALALASDDTVGYSVDADQTHDPSLIGDFHMENWAVTSGVSWVNTSLRNFTSTLTFYDYQTLIDESQGTGLDENDRQSVAGLKEEADWKAGEWLGLKHAVSFGLSAEMADISTHAFTFRNNDNGILSDPTATAVTAQSVNRSAYAQDRVQIDPAWAFTAGLRYDQSDEIAGDVVMPRLSLEWQFDSRTTWKAAWGLYDQFPESLQTNPDFGNPGLSANLAEHWVLSLEKKFSHEFSGRIDAYYKNYYNLVVTDPAIQNYVNEGVGNAKGVEILLREDLGDRFSGWLSYAYSQSDRRDLPGSPWSAYQYDQPHILTLVANYKIDSAWSVGAKLHYNSGPLVKSLLGRYQDSSGLWQPVFSDTYDQRLGDYLRLDLRTDYSWRFEGWRLNAYFEILNALNRPNPAGINYSADYSQSSVVNNLPRIPYCGLEVQF